jgi:hypothetical protein
MMIRFLFEAGMPCGHLGGNVALDFILERMNLEVSNMIDKDVSPVRIQESIRQLNGIRHVIGHALEAFGLGDDVDSGECTGILDSDVKAVCHHLKNAPWG